MAIVFTLIIIPSINADTEITQEELCVLLDQEMEFCLANYGVDVLCGFLMNDDSNYLYDEMVDTCYLLDDQEISSSTNNTTNQATATTNQTTATTGNTQVQELKNKITTLETTITSLQTEINSLKSKQGTSSTQISELNTKVNSHTQDLTKIKSDLSKVETGVKQEISSMATGLAGLQDDLNQTNTELVNVEEGLAKEQSFTKFISYTFFILLVIAIALGAIYYINRKTGGINKKLDPKIVNYITNMIQKGHKFPQIKDHLQKSGWNESDIQWAYKETMKKNYQSYLKKKVQPTSNITNNNFNYSQPAQIKLGMDKHKIFAIIGISLFLILGIILILNASVGNAIFYQKLVGGEVDGNSGEVTYTIDCTPPHILNPNGDACCLDEFIITTESETPTPNNICDYIERLQSKVEENFEEDQTCSDNYECPSGQYCINSKCGLLEDIYQNKDGSCNCNYEFLKMSTSDGDSYNLKAGKGSYTAAGAVEWKILEAPNHCPEEDGIVPVRIIRKDKGKIVNEEVITVNENGVSQPITHPTLPKINFELTVEELYEPVGC